jgi:hypothetical protein
MYLSTYSKNQGFSRRDLGPRASGNRFVGAIDKLNASIIVADLDRLVGLLENGEQSRHRATSRRESRKQLHETCIRRRTEHDLNNNGKQFIFI